MSLRSQIIRLSASLKLNHDFVLTVSAIFDLVYDELCAIMLKLPLFTHETQSKGLNRYKTFATTYEHICA